MEAEQFYAEVLGFEKVLEYEGVGYRAEMNGPKLVLYLGFSHPIEVEPPEGVSFEVEAKSRQVFVRGFNKEDVGQTCANLEQACKKKGKDLRVFQDGIYIVEKS